MQTQKSVDTCLEQLKKITTVVADTSDFESMEAYSPHDATTNPSLILKSVEKEKNGRLLNQSIDEERKSSASGEILVDRIVDNVLVRFGQEILKLIPGRVSTEVDASLSFDRPGTIAKAEELVGRYERAGVDRERILIKVASTWEGIRAAEELEKKGIHCNLTLMFSLTQAAACADAGVTLISPFVGRIYDWHRKDSGKDFSGQDDPGVQSVNAIYRYIRRFEFSTEVMGASFRNTGQILELAGCDLLTISLDLLEELARMREPVTRKLDPESARQAQVEKLDLDEKAFRWRMNEDAMATEKLAEGIRVFNRDKDRLKEMIRAAIGA